MLDFTLLQSDELRSIVENAQAELSRRVEEDRQQAIADLRSLASKVGITPIDLAALADPIGFKLKFPQPTAQTTESTRGNDRRKEPVGPPKYRNPDDPTQTWTGRGKHPNWFKQALASGRSQDDLLV